MSTTTVTGTVVDPDGIAWASGQAIFKLINSNPNIVPSVGGVPLTQAQQNFSVPLDGTGSFSTSVTDTATIMPISQWQVEFTSNTSSSAQYLTKMNITGASQSLNIQIAAQIIAIRLPASPFTRAYADIEIYSPPPAGATYYNTTSNSTRLWNGSSWVSGGGGSVKQVSASSIGVVMDCNVATGQKIGGGTPTDNTTVLNTWLASVGGITNPVELLVDGGFACKGVVLPSAGYVKLRGIGQGAGVFILPGSNADPIQNGIPYNIGGFSPVGVAPAPGGPVHLENFMINGNRGNGTNGNCNTGDPRGISGTYFYCNITLYGVNGLYIKDMYIYDAPAYSIRIMNCVHVWIKNNIIYNPNTTTTINNDGVHVDGPGSDIHIIDNLINNNYSDDGIAINPPEGYSGGYNIEDVEILGNNCESVLHGVRIYGFADNNLGTVNCSNNNIIANNTGIYIGANSAGTGDASGRVLNFNGNTCKMVAGGAFFLISSSVGVINISNCVMRNGGFGGNFVNCQFANGLQVSALNISKCSIYRSTDGNTTALNLLQAGITITFNRVSIDDFKIIDQTGHSYGNVTKLLGMSSITINTLTVGTLDMTNVSTFCDSYTNIGAFNGPGLGSQASAQSAAYTLQPTDSIIYATAGSAFTVTLPAKKYIGHNITVIKVDASANAVTLGGTISGVANPTLTTQYSFANFTTDGTNWYNC